MTKDIKEIYAKYNLPDFELVNKEFEITGIELEKWNFLNALCRISIEKINRMTSYVVPFFIPSGYYANLIINNVKDKETIARAKKFYKKMMIWYHQGLKAELETDENKQVEFFNKLWKEYPTMKKEVTEFLDICEDVFKIEEKEDAHKGGYLGWFM